MRNALQQFEDSRFADGLTASRYPSAIPQVIPPYSLFWIAMVYDYWMHRDDPEFVKSFLPGIYNILAWYEKQIDQSGMLGPMAWWNFTDWVPDWRRGVPPGADKGNSALISMQYIYNLNYAAQLCETFGESDKASSYRKISDSVKKVISATCWDEEKRLFADTPDKTEFSQHTNVMAILVDLVSDKNMQVLMEKVLSYPDLQKCTFYYQFYLFEALNKAGLANRYIELLQPWRDMLNLGLTTFAEKPEPVRSDCHAWSASPNYHLLATICGITPNNPGFKSVNITPNLGELDWVEGKIPHPQGTISVKLYKKGNEGLSGVVELPPGISGQFVWQNRKVKLLAGTQKIDL
jgi:glycogen debranching enzyme